LWKKPGYYLWLLAITACIYNYVSNNWNLYFHDARGGALNIGVLFIGLFLYYMVMKIGYSALMTLLSNNAIATTAINVGYLLLSVLLPGYFIYREINDANAVYKQAVADAKNQNTDTSASVPSPIVYEIVAVTAYPSSQLRFP
jgi:divalent metal cation (Fe/Co/Zn/Cd) transporter